MTTPYYQDDLVTLYHGDCREITEWLAADVLVTDPPYGIAWTRHGISNTASANRRPGRYGESPQRVNPLNDDGIAGDQSTAARDDALALWGQKPASTENQKIPGS